MDRVVCLTRSRVGGRLCHRQWHTLRCGRETVELLLEKGKIYHMDKQLPYVAQHRNRSI